MDNPTRLTAEQLQEYIDGFAALRAVGLAAVDTDPDARALESVVLELKALRTELADQTFDANAEHDRAEKLQAELAQAKQTNEALKAQLTGAGIAPYLDRMRELADRCNIRIEQLAECYRLAGGIPHPDIVTRADRAVEYVTSAMDLLATSKAKLAQVEEQLSQHLTPSAPNPCSICGGFIIGPHIGTGDGTMKNGGSFAHPDCYYRQRLAQVEQERDKAIQARQEFLDHYSETQEQWRDLQRQLEQELDSRMAEVEHWVTKYNELEAWRVQTCQRAEHAEAELTECRRGRVGDAEMIGRLMGELSALRARLTAEELKNALLDAERAWINQGRYGGGFHQSIAVWLAQRLTDAP